MIKDIQAQGVNLQKGKQGWHKRIDWDVTDVSRAIHLIDGHVIHNIGEGLNQVEVAAKKAIIPEHKPAIIPDASLFGNASSSGQKHLAERLWLPLVVGKRRRAGENASYEDSEEVKVGFLGIRWVKSKACQDCTGKGLRPPRTHPRGRVAARSRIRRHPSRRSRRFQLVLQA